MKAEYLIPRPPSLILNRPWPAWRSARAPLKLPPITMTVGERVRSPYLRVYGDSEVTWVRATERDDAAALEAEGACATALPPRQKSAARRRPRRWLGSSWPPCSTWRARAASA